MSEPNWTDILQTIAVVAALVFTGWEMRARTREQKFRNYLDAVAGFMDLNILMVEKPELHGLYAYSTKDIDSTYDELTPEQKALVFIALCETVWLAKEKKWVSEDEWPYWKRWLDQLKNSPEFRWTVRWVDGTYDEPFLSTLRSPLVPASSGVASRELHPWAAASRLSRAKVKVT